MLDVPTGEVGETIYTRKTALTTRGLTYDFSERTAPSNDNPRKSYKRLVDVFNTLPVHFTGRIRDLDNLFAKVLIEAHSALVLSIHEISIADPNLLVNLEESEEWDLWLANIRKTIISFRKDVKKQIHGIATLVPGIPDASKGNIENFINLDANVIHRVTGVNDFPIDLKQSLGDIVAILGKESESKLDYVTPDKSIKNVLTGIEAEANYLETWLLKKTEGVKQDIAKCYALLKRENKEDSKNLNFTGDSHLLDQLKQTFKFYGQYKVVKNVLTLESTIMRIAITGDNKFVYGGGSNCRIRKRELIPPTNAKDVSIYTEKSTCLQSNIQSTLSLE